MYKTKIEPIHTTQRFQLACGDSITLFKKFKHKACLCILFPAFAHYYFKPRKTNDARSE